MKIVQPSANLLVNNSDDCLSFIEEIARTCYKSKSKGNPAEFVKQLVKSQHYAMLEHQVFVFEVSPLVYQTVRNQVGSSNPFIHLTYNHDEKRHLISGNARALNDFEVHSLLYTIKQLYPELVYSIDPTPSDYKCKLVDLDNVPNLSQKEKDNHLYTTFHFVCDRGVSHELVRHRLCSFAQESTRYCNYSLGKFGNELTFVEPSNFKEWNSFNRGLFYSACDSAENYYLSMIEQGCTPEQARSVLPNSIKTEIIVTASHKEWTHIFNLRYFGTTGNPHPDMKYLMTGAYKIYTEYVSNL